MLTPQSRQQDFPSLTRRAYLNTAAEGIPSPPVAVALAQYAQDKLLGMDGRQLHEARWRAVREKAAGFYGLSPEEIAHAAGHEYNLAEVRKKHGIKPSIPAPVQGMRLRDGRWTANGPATVILVVGDARDITVDEVAFVHKGVIGPWRDMDIEGLRQSIRDWGQWALAHPVRSGGEGR